MNKLEGGITKWKCMWWLQMKDSEYGVRTTENMQAKILEEEEESNIECYRNKPGTD